MYTPSVSDFGKDYTIHRDRIVIYGKNGCGKTTLANLLARDYDSLTIDTKLLKQHEEIRNMVSNHIGKRNVLSLLQGIDKPKAILFDNADTFYSYDDISFKYLMGLFRDTTYQITMIVICHPSFYKNRTLQKTIFQDIYLTYTISEYQKAIRKIASSLSLTSRDYDLKKLSQETDFNFHNVYEILSRSISHSPSKMLPIGDYCKDISDITRELLEQTYDLEDIIRLSESDSSVIGLNMLENVSKGIQYKLEKDMSNLYRNYIISDMFETYMNRHSEWCMREYVIIFSVYSLYLCYKQHRYIPEQLIYNKYISRAMTSIGNQTTLMNIQTINGIRDLNDIYYHFYQYFINGSDTSYLIIRNLSPKQLRLLSKGFTYFYHRPITAKELWKLTA